MANDVLIIGGGLAGLSAATYAARAGAAVRVFEKAGQLGGRASTRDQHGFRLNQGAHALYRAGAGRRVLDELGVAVPGGTPSTVGGYALADGTAHAFPAGFLSLISTGLLPWAGKMEVARILATLPRARTEGWRGRTVSEVLAELSRRNDVRQLLLALIRLSTYGNDPDRQSGGDAIDQLRLALDQSVTYVDGGWQTIVDGLAAAARAAGVQIETSARIDRIESTPDGITARAGSQAHAADAVIFATGPDEAADTLSGPTAQRVRRWAREAVPSYAACLDVCLDAAPRPRATFALGVDVPLYLSLHSAVARLAPDGHALVHCMKYLGPTLHEDDGQAEREMEDALDLLQPGWRSHVVHRRFLPQMRVVHDLAGADGGGVRGRPGPSLPDAGGIFFAGDWVGDEGLLADASLASGKRAGELAAARRGTAAAA